MDNKIIIKDSFTMPAVDDTVNVIVSKSIGLTPECWIWNDSVGYLKVVKFSLYDNQVTLENVGRIENAKAGTQFPTCMEFLITAPAPVDLYNSMSTCLKADFNSPSVGNEALMSVESSYAISVDDQVIIDRTYRYLVTQIVNSTTLKVKNEGLGATGIIHVDCNECTPVQVVNQLNCCPIPTGDLTSNTSVITIVDGEEVLLAPSSITLDTDLSQYDNSVSKFIDVNGVPRGTLSSNSNLITVTDGTNNVLDNISLDLDTDLSKYNNTTSGYITLGDVPRGTLSSDSNLITVLGGVNNVLDNISLDLDTDLSKYDNSTSEFLATTDKKDLTSNTSVLTVTNGTGATLDNTSLTLDTDLSQYDNTTSSFLASSDKKDLSSTTPILTITNGTGATLENVSLTVNTDLSQYDNSVSQFVSAGGLASGTLSSNSSLLIVNNGIDSILTNVSLDLDDDLSHYDNTTSAFITLGDIPALPSDTDLSHYDNSTSGFITSSSLPTVNDAKLTIYESDGVTPFVEFTANASSAVTATLPSSGSSYTATSPISIDANNDISISQATTSTDGYLSSTDWNTFNSKASSLVYFEEYYSGSVANWQPKSGSASYFDLGYPGNGFTTAYIGTVKKENSYFTLPSDGGDININCGTGGTYHTNYGDINFSIGNGNKLNLQPTQAVFDVNVVRKSSSNLSLGTSTNAWYEGWIQYLKTNQFKTVSGTAISVQANLEPGTNNTYTIGDTNYYNKIHTNNLYVGNIRIGGPNVTSINVETNTNINYSATSGTLKLLPPTTSSSTASTLGDSTHHWKNIYATNTYSNTVDPNSNNSGHVGSNNNYYAQMHCSTLTQHSDRKDKENIIERNIIERNITKGKITTSLDKVNSIRTYTFNFKDGDNVRTHLGVMADEIYEIEPLCASLLEDDTSGSKSIEGTPTGIDIGAMITLLLEGIKELSSEVKELKSKLGEKDANSEVLEK